MKKTVLFILVLSHLQFVCAQGNSTPSCIQVERKCKETIPLLLSNGNIDSLSSVLASYKEFCGSDESLRRFEILYAIYTDSFSEDIYKNYSIIHELEWYKSSYTPISYRYPGCCICHYDKQDSIFDQYVKRFAQKIKHEKSLDSLESFFIDIYGEYNGVDFNRLQQPAFAHTQLKKEYERTQQEYYEYFKARNNRYGIHINIKTGLWIPMKQLNTLGIHPLFGIDLGISWKKIMFNLETECRFLNAPNQYQVQLNDSIYNTNNFNSYFIGGQFGIELYRSQIHEIDLYGGIGYDLIRSLKIKGTYNTPSTVKEIKTRNLSLSLMYIVAINKYKHMGIELKYNFLNYKNDFGTDLSGNAIALNVKYFLYRDKNENQLNNRLKYRQLEQIRAHTLKKYNH